MKTRTPRAQLWYSDQQAGRRMLGAPNEQTGSRATPATEQTEEQGDDENGNKDVKEDLSDPRRRPRNASETKDRGYDRDHQEY